MLYVFAILSVINSITVAVAFWYVRTLDERVSGILADAIAKEIRMQDDRIQKRVQRMDGHSPDSNATPVEAGPNRVGQPYRRPQ